MSKFTKLIKSPVAFFSDAKKNKTNNQSANKKTSTEKKTPNKPKKSPSSSTSSIINKAKAPLSFSSILDRVGLYFHNPKLTHSIAVYFDGDLGNFYQIQQWFSPLNHINNTENKVIIITRQQSVFLKLKNETNFCVAYCKTIDDLLSLYTKNSDLKCILYVNHAARNFQSLIYGKALHVHINHGESDKISTITNQSKAYDYIFLVGDAAFKKYELNLIKKDMSKYIKIGRPQLEHIEKIESPIPSELLIKQIDNKKEENTTQDSINAIDSDSLNATPDLISSEQPEHCIKIIKREEITAILYAPTWESTHESMNYTSINDFGITLIQELLQEESHFLIYRPHPNTGSRDAKTKKNHAIITEYIKNHPRAKTLQGGDINSIYEHIDIAIFDNSAVAIDYLATNKPMLLTNTFHNTSERMDQPKITFAARMLKTECIKDIKWIIEEELNLDKNHIEREKIKEYFLGNFDYTQKESTNEFSNQIASVIKERDLLINNLIEQNKLN